MVRDGWQAANHGTMLLLLFSLHGCALHRTSEATEPAIDTTAELSWLANGEAIQVGRQVRNLQNGQWLAPPTDWDQPAFSQNGAQAARVVLDDTYPRQNATIEVTTLGTSGHTSFPVPQFLDLADAGEPEKAEMFATTSVAWLDDSRLLAHQTSYMAYSACRILQVVDLSLSVPAAGCPESDFADFDAIEPGPKHVLAVYSSGEGHPGINLVRWQADKQDPLPLPPIELYPAGPLRVSFSAASEDIWLQTPCDLRIERGCAGWMDADVPPPDFVFRWSPTEPERWQVAHEGVPSGAVFDPNTQRFAWISENELCVGAAVERRKGSCVPVRFDVRVQ